MALLTFERHEKKFVITKKQKEIILNSLKNHICLDEYAMRNGMYRVYSLYFDNINNDIARYNNSRPLYKEKLRLRSYIENTQNDDIVYLEIKKKYKGFGNKRRIALTYKDAIDYLLNQENIKYNDYLSNQIKKEIDYYLNNNQVKPTCFITCDREPYYDINDNDIRITFDSNIVYRKEKVNFKENKELDISLTNDEIIMEVKFTNSIPIYLTKILSELKIYSQGYSKYGKVFEKELRDNKNISLETKCNVKLMEETENENIDFELLSECNG